MKDLQTSKKTIFSRFLEKSGLKHVLLLSGSVLVAQSLGILTQPLVTRLYTPEAIGSLALFSSLSVPFLPLVSLQYHRIIVTVKTDQEADHVTSLCLWFACITTILYTIGLLIYNYHDPTVHQELGGWFYVAILSFFLSGLAQIVLNYNTRYEQYKIIAKVSLYRSIVSNSFKIIGGIFKFGYPGLIIAYLLGNIAGIKKQSQTLWTNRKRVLSTKFRDIKKIAIQNKEQPLFSLPGIFASTFAMSIIPLFLKKLYSLSEVGYFSVTQLIVFLPVSLISSNVASVFYRNASKEYNTTGNYYETFKYTFFLLLSLSVPLFLILYFIAPSLCGFVFGSSWSRTGEFMQLWIPVAFTNFTATVFIQALIISGKQLVKMIVQCLFLLEIFIIYRFAVRYSWDIEQFLRITAYAYSLVYIILIFIVYRASRKKDPLPSH